MGAAVAVADFDRDGWQDFYVTNSAEDSLNRLYRNNGDGTFTDVAEQLGLADVNRTRDRRVDGRRSGATSTTTAARTCWSTSTAGPSCSATTSGRSLRAVSASAPACRRGSTPTAPPGSTTTATACSICSSPATGPTTSICGSSRRRRSCRRASSTRTTAAASTCCATGATARSRTSPRRWASRSRRWTLAVAAADLFGTGYPDCSSPTTTACRSCSPTQGGKRFEDVAADTGVGVARRRAA